MGKSGGLNARPQWARRLLADKLQKVVHYCLYSRKSLLCSLVRMDFLKQARAGLATSGCTLELVLRPILGAIEYNTVLLLDTSVLYIL